MNLAEKQARIKDRERRRTAARVIDDTGEGGYWWRKERGKKTYAPVVIDRIGEAQRYVAKLKKRVEKEVADA